MTPSTKLLDFLLYCCLYSIPTPIPCILQFQIIYTAVRRFLSPCVFSSYLPGIPKKQIRAIVHVRTHTKRLHTDMQACRQTVFLGGTHIIRLQQLRIKKIQNFPRLCFLRHVQIFTRGVFPRGIFPGIILQRTPPVLYDSFTRTRNFCILRVYMTLLIMPVPYPEVLYCCCCFCCCCLYIESSFLPSFISTPSVRPDSLSYLRGTIVNRTKYC